jgi:hypothetical protein
MNEIRELTEMEVEAVSGGDPLINIEIDPIFQTNFQALFNVGGELGSLAAAFGRQQNQIHL